MKHIRRIGLYIIFTATVPLLVTAQGVADLSYIKDAVSSLYAIIGQLIPLAISIGLLVFIWGLVQFIASLGDPDSRQVGIRRMVWGIIALFVIVSVWGIVDILNQITGIEQGSDVVIPVIPL